MQFVSVKFPGNSMRNRKHFGASQNLLAFGLEEYISRDLYSCKAEMRCQQVFSLRVVTTFFLVIIITRKNGPRRL